MPCSLTASRLPKLPLQLPRDQFDQKREVCRGQRGAVTS
ncbi:hypothetical protein TCAP_07332 [Tolypocladium capitatum]|uniref:Uncharacterized protein n=1 Tax=Tolypocladium capitatum TaxID=45235 RepID=A0A2K3PZC4_9HYPO|nr:hypothetical protein TCAP_07332 [Tolypocladium capitatum]